MSQFFPGFARARFQTSGAEINARISGDGPALLMLHGYPQSHVMWHRLAPVLARDFTVVACDLRGYGDSSRPPAGAHCANYAKRAMAQDQVEVMAALGFDRFMVVGHDRGGRVAHRMALDFPERVERLAVLDIVPTLDVFEGVDQETAMRYFHWFFLAQPRPLPERMIGADPEQWLRGRLAAWSRTRRAFHPAAVAEYLRCFSKPEVIRATCDDYRAAAGIDLEHDRADARRLFQPLLVLWGTLGFVGARYDVLAEWRKRAEQVSGQGLACGHFLPEEQPRATCDLLTEFFSARELPTRVPPDASARPAEA
ncbi:MAG: alpha/beta hydrolase [Pseudomonadota bacterium]|nr:alpha/beta hydrolase [Pseudomonadota bacterium]